MADPNTEEKNTRIRTARDALSAFSIRQMSFIDVTGARACEKVKQTNKRPLLPINTHTPYDISYMYLLLHFYSPIVLPIEN